MGVQSYHVSGSDALLTVQRMFAAFSTRDVDGRFRGARDTVVVFGNEAGVVRATGALFRNVWTQKYVVRDGQIIRMVEYNIQTEPD